MVSIALGGTPNWIRRQLFDVDFVERRLMALAEQSALPRKILATLGDPPEEQCKVSEFRRIEVCRGVLCDRCVRHLGVSRSVMFRLPQYLSVDRSVD